MVTFFAIPKPFRGHINIIQRNAITIWTKQPFAPEIILLGDEHGTAQVAEELGVRHIPTVRCNEHGTPFLDDAFAQAQSLARYGLVCYVNADIMLTSRMSQALRAVAGRLRQFLVIGRRTLLDVQHPWDFSQPDWEEKLHAQALEARLDLPEAVDYFAFPRGAYAALPPFLVGRVGWDNWMIYSARERGIPVVNVTRDVPVFHQNHDYSHLARGMQDCRTGPEGEYNQRLYGSKICFSILDSTYELRNGHLRPALAGVYLRRHLYTFSLIHPALAPLGRVVSAALRAYHALRRRVIRGSWRAHPTDPALVPQGMEQTHTETAKKASDQR
jgi:hypothetical protein